MEKSLLLLQLYLTRKAHFSCKALVMLVLLFLCASNVSRAQVYYLTSDASASSLNTDDALNRMNYDGTSNTRMVSSFSNSPVRIEQDLANSRLFIYEGLAAQKSIKVVNSGTGAITASISVPYNVSCMRYDAATDYIYFTTTSGGIALDVSDAIYKVKPTETTPTLIASSITTSPLFLALDVANSRVFIYESVPANRGIKTFDLTSKTITASATINAGTVVDIAYDSPTGYIYYLTNDGSATNLGATDALNKILPGASTTIVIKAQVTGSPGQCMLLDAGNNRAYIYEALIANRAIKAVNLTTGDVTTVLSLTSYPNAVTVSAMASAYVPALTTTAASGITAASATLGGNVTRTDAAVSARGVVYSSSNQTPTIADNKTTNGSGTGIFSASITGLSSSTTYYARSYATSTAGTGYGPVVTFATPSNDATLSAFSISSGTLTPTFAAATTSYTASVTNATTSITVTPTRNQANAIIKVNNTTVTSGSASGNLNLSIGDNVISTVVTAQDGTTTKTYTTTVNRPKAVQTITFASTNSKTFGNVDFAAGGSASSGLTVSYSSSNTAVATVSGSTIHIVGAGSTTITASQAGDASYLAATSATQTLTVDKAAQTITFGTITAKTYGTADFVTGATINSPLPITYASDNTAVATIVSNQVHIVGQGTANITASQAGTTNYNAAANVVQNFTVNKANLTITAAAKTKVYGDSDPAFTYTATGVVASDAPTGALSRVLPNENKFIGTYTIDQSTLSYGNNYNVTYVGANLTINKRPVTVLPVAKTKVYGEVDPFLNQFQIIAGSLAPGDATGDQFGRAPGENVGTYLMTLGTKKFYSNGSSGFIEITSNYDVTVQTAYVTITAKPVTVTASAQTKTYGDADPALTYSTDVSLAFSDAFTGALSRAAGENFGTYAINKNTLALSSNYALTYTTNNLTIGKKTINVTADAKNKTYGDTDPALTYTADAALPNGESFTGAISRAAGETFSTYAIGQNSLALSSNYTLNFTGSNFTIDKKAINVAAVANSKTFGDTDPALTYTADALVAGDTYSGNVERATGEAAGDYPIGQGTLAVSNAASYALNYTPANFTINKRAIDIYTLSQDVQFGNPDTGIGYYYSGTVASGDALSGAPGRTPGTAIGTYATTLGTLAITNGASYDLVFHSAPYNIIQREVVVSGGSTIKIYGDADPAINYSIVSGSLLGGTTITGALARDAGETAGPYNVTQGTLAINDSNYKLTFQGGYFEVDRSPLTITIDNKTKVATKANPALTYSVSGYRNGDAEATTFLAPISLTTDATINSAAGDYNIYPVGSVNASNYNVTTVGGTLTVTPASTINTLASATLNGGGFNEPFDPATDFYTVSTPNGVPSATLVATITDPLSTMTIGAYPAVAVPIASGTPYTINFTNNNTEQVGVHVTAEDGSIKSYYFNVSPIPSDSKLSNLVTSTGIMTPSFDPNIRFYALDVSAETDSVTITPTTHDPLATARVSGGEGGGTGPKKVALFEGTNVKSISAKSADGTSTTLYTLVIKRPIRLKTLTLSAGHLSPAFDPNVTSYVAKVDLATPAITVTPMGNQTYFQMLVNGDYVNYGDASAPVTIAEDGSTTIAVKITAGDGETTKTYTINVQHASVDATLSGIALSTGSLNPAFNSTDTTYNVALPNSTTAISFTPTATEPNATIKVNNAPLASGASVTNSSLSVGVHHYSIAVTAADGATTKTYTLSITRAPSNQSGLANILLSTGTLSPVFDQLAGNSYTVLVPNEISSIAITPSLADTTGSLSATLNGSNVALSAGVITAPLNIGANSVVITSLAQDGTTMSVNTLTVTRAADFTLSNLTLSSGSLSPGFHKNTVAYTATVANAVTSLTLTPTASDALATVKVNGTISTNGVASGPVTLLPGANNIAVEVTATDGGVKTYAVTVTRLKSAYLSKIEFTPSSTVTRIGTSNNFTTSVSLSLTTIRLIPTSVEASSTILVNGSAVGSGLASDPITLNSGPTVITMAVTAPDGSSTQNYTVTVNKSGSSNAYLSKIATNPLSPLTQVSGPADLNYTATVGSLASTISLTLTAQDAGSVIKINGTTVASGVASGPIILTGASTPIDVLVTAENGTTTKTYRITAVKGLSDNAYLSKIESNPFASVTQVSGPADLNYTTTVSSSASTISLTLTAQDAGSVIRVNGSTVASGVASAPITLTGASTPIDVLVTAENGTSTKTYRITVLKGLSGNAYLSKIATNPLSPLAQVSGPADLNYTATVGSSASTISLTLTAQDAGSAIKINGTTVASGVASGPITLTGASTPIDVLVTAENGTTTKTYRITAVKGLSDNAYLSKIATNPLSPLTQVSGPADLNYTATVGSLASTISLTLTAQDAGSVIKINGTTVASGVASGPIILTGASTPIDVLVTAENGTTTKTYRITAVKGLSDNAYLSKIESNPFASVTQVSGPADLNYTTTVSSSASTISLTLTAQDAGSVIRVNGSTVASGVASAPITLTGASTPIDVLVTAENGTSTKTYRITVLKGLSGNAYLSKISLYPYNITQVTGSSDLNYATTIGSSVNSVWLTLTAQDAGAVIRINGTVQASGTTYGPIAISNTTTQVSVLVTAENGTSIKTYGITINRPAPVVIAAVNKNKDQINVIQKPDPTPDASADELVVKQAVSPNGDGINDRFTIQGINAFPENTVRIMNRNGDVVYEAKGYDNENKAFDGHNSRGTLQQAGTYFYSVEYKKGTETKRKTGYIVVKY